MVEFNRHQQKRKLDQVLYQSLKVVFNKSHPSEIRQLQKQAALATASRITFSIKRQLPDWYKRYSAIYDPFLPNAKKKRS